MSIFHTLFEDYLVLCPFLLDPDPFLFFLDPDPYSSSPLIRIRILIRNEFFHILDPHPYPYQYDSDPQHWLQHISASFRFGCENMVQFLCRPSLALKNENTKILHVVPLF